MALDTHIVPNAYAKVAWSAFHRPFGRHDCAMCVKGCEQRVRFHDLGHLVGGRTPIDRPRCPGRLNGICRFTIKSQTSSTSVVLNPSRLTSAALCASKPLRLGARSQRRALRPDLASQTIGFLRPGGVAQVDDARLSSNPT